MSSFSLKKELVASTKIVLIFTFIGFAIDFAVYRLFFSQQALYYFQGNLQQARLNTVFNGPTTGDYTLSDTLGINNLVWAPCGSQSGLNINTSLLAKVGPNNPNGFAQLTTDSADGSVQTTYALQWQRCR